MDHQGLLGSWVRLRSLEAIVRNTVAAFYPLGTERALLTGSA
jgi:hypothetical protein